MKELGVTVLDGFTQNIDLVKRYYERMYPERVERVVLCGINPGRLGAGKTGIPFLDNESISRLFPDFKKTSRERSAQFIMSIIDAFGHQAFHEKVYMTNISWYGFEKDRKNFNYHKLPEDFRNYFTKTFIEEMAIVRPKVIIPLSKEVENTLIGMKQKGELDFLITDRLPHPNYASFKSRVEHSKKLYIEKIVESSSP